MTRVFVSGVGVVSPIGTGTQAFFEALLRGQSGRAEVRSFDTSAFDRSMACEVKSDFDPRDHLTGAEIDRAGRCSQFAIAAARMAVAQSGIAGDALAGPRTSVIMGTTMGEALMLGDLTTSWIHQGPQAVQAARVARYGTGLLPIHVARAVGARGMVHAIPAACAAGNYAIGFATDMIQSGRADVVITGGSEVLAKLQYAGFCRLGAITPDVVRPFDEQRRGILIGEGAGMMVLESQRHLEARGGTALAEVGGVGLACDAHHITRPAPDGAGSVSALRNAIDESGLSPDDVDHVNAHGTATQANDKVESSVLDNVFGRRIPVTSIKSMTGHCMGAASAIEAVSCVLSIGHDVIPPTMNHETLDPECRGVDVVAGAPRYVRTDVVLNNSLAFGGYDAAVLFAKPGRLDGARTAA